MSTPDGPHGHDSSSNLHVAYNSDPPSALSLSNLSLVSVDLANTHPATTSLSLAANSLTSLDLSPLSCATNLTALILNGNALTTLDLSPLAHTPSLERLWLHNNALTSLDLSPLSTCTSLRSLYLDANKLDNETLDLTPLAGAGAHLRALRLGRNRLGGELDITPILQCSALSTLDTCASVKLTARTDGAVPAPLPPALRRRAATVYWTDAEEEKRSREAALAEEAAARSHHLSASLSGTTTPDAAAAVAEAAIIAANAAAAVAQEPTTSHHHYHLKQQQPRRHYGSHLTRGEAQPHSPSSPYVSSPVLPSSLPESESLEELAALCSRPPEPRTPAVVMLDFRRNQRFAAEALLREHGGVEPCVVSSPAARTSEVLDAVGALSTCRVFMVRPDAIQLMRELRAKDDSLPIIVVGSEAERETKARECETAGATCYLAEPLGERDAIIIRAYAQKRSAGLATAAYRSQRYKRGQQTSGSSPVSVQRPNGLSSPGSHATLPASPGHASSSSLSASVSSSPSTSSFSQGASCRAQSSGTHTTTMTPPLRSPTVTLPLRSRQTSESQVPPLGTSAPVNTPAVGRARLSPCSPLIDFGRLRERQAGITKGRSSRIEESAIGMLFSRCGGRAFPSDFSAIATLCGLPVCASSLLHGAALAWGEIGSTSAGAVSPALSPISIMAFGSSGGDSGLASSTKPSGKDFERKGGVSGGSSKCSIADMMDQSEEHARQAEGVSYDTFRDFWQTHLRHRDSETRLFNVMCTAHHSEGAAPASAVEALASALVSSRSPEMDAEENRGLAAAVLCFEIKGLEWNWIRRKELARVKLCAALLAAESGMYNGCCAHLRADRMSDIRLAFAAASGKRVGCSPTLALSNIAWLNRERGLLSERAVEAIFSRFEGDMDLARFAPMWLAVNAPDSRSAIEYFFGILDANADGYIGAVDAAHFYSEKKKLLCSDGFIATGFESIWCSIVDSACVGGSHSMEPNAFVSLTEMRRLSPRDAATFCQSLLFVEDQEMALVDIRATKMSGSPAAVLAVADL